MFLNNYVTVVTSLIYFFNRSFSNIDKIFFRSTKKISSNMQRIFVTCFVIDVTFGECILFKGKYDCAHRTYS